MPKIYKIYYVIKRIANKIIANKFNLNKNRRNAKEKNANKVGRNKYGFPEYGNWIALFKKERLFKTPLILQYIFFIYSGIVWAFHLTFKLFWAILIK